MEVGIYCRCGYSTFDTGEKFCPDCGQSLAGVEPEEDEDACLDRSDSQEGALVEVLFVESSPLEDAVPAGRYLDLLIQRCSQTGPGRCSSEWADRVTGRPQLCTRPPVDGERLCVVHLLCQEFDYKPWRKIWDENLSPQHWLTLPVCRCGKMKASGAIKCDACQESDAEDRARRWDLNYD